MVEKSERPHLLTYPKSISSIGCSLAAVKQRRGTKGSSRGSKITKLEKKTGKFFRKAEKGRNEVEKKIEKRKKK